AGTVYLNCSPAKCFCKCFGHLGTIAVLYADEKYFFHCNIFLITIAEAGQTEENSEVFFMDMGTSSLSIFLYPSLAKKSFAESVSRYKQSIPFCLEIFSSSLLIICPSPFPRQFFLTLTLLNRAQSSKNSRPPVPSIVLFCIRAKRCLSGPRSVTGKLLSCSKSITALCIFPLAAISLYSAIVSISCIFIRVNT